MRKSGIVAVFAVLAMLVAGPSFADDAKGPERIKGVEDCPLKAAGKDCPLEKAKAKDKDCPMEEKDCPLKAAGKDCPKEALKDCDKKKKEECDKAKKEECDKEDHKGHSGENCPLKKYAVKGQHKGDIPAILKNKESLGVTQAQVGQLVQIMMDGKKAKIRKQAELDILEIDLKAELHKSPVNMEKASTLLREKERIEADMAIGCLASREDALKVLSDDQRAKLREMKGKGH